MRMENKHTMYKQYQSYYTKMKKSNKTTLYKLHNSLKTISALPNIVSLVLNRAFVFVLALIVLTILIYYIKTL